MIDATFTYTVKRNLYEPTIKQYKLYNRLLQLHNDKNILHYRAKKRS